MPSTPMDGPNTIVVRVTRPAVDGVYEGIETETGQTVRFRPASASVSKRIEAAVSDDRAIRVGMERQAAISISD